MSAVRRTLPERPSLEQQKTLAKELLTAYRSDDREAIARVRAQLPDKKRIVLADAQLVIAREYGFRSWNELRTRIESLRVDTLPPMERFKTAVQAGDAQALRRVLQAHAEVRAAINEPVFPFDSPALVAASDVNVVDVLLEFGADPNRRSTWWAGGFHPLHGARGAVAQRLMAGGSIPDACAAANLDRADLLERMLADDPQRVHERGGDGKLPLHFARSRRVVDLLLDAGADVDARDIDHRSTAAEWMLGDDPDDARRDLAKYLVERGASADIFLAAALGITDRARTLLDRNPSLLALRTSQGDYAEKPPSSYHIYQWTIGPNFTPLQVAAKFGQRETLEAMLQFAPPEQRLLLACHEGRAAEARDIVHADPGIVERLEGADRRALTDEAWAANAPAVELMMELGFDPAASSVSGPTGGTALHCASWQGCVACVRAILAYDRGRALIEAVESTYGGTPLSWCSHGARNSGDTAADHVGVARLLIGAGARPSAELLAHWDVIQVVLDEAAAQK